MDIMEEINKKRRGEEITKESVSEIMKEMAPDMTEALKDYAPVIDQVIQDFGVSSEYGIYEEDGHMFMCIPTSAVDLKSVDGYTYTTEGGFTIVQLDAVNKECGSMGAGTSGASNARYSDKPKKSKTEKSYEDLTNLDYEGLKDLCNSMDSDATEKITREYEAGYIGEADAIGRLTLLAMKSDAEGLSLMNKSKTEKALVEGETVGGLPYGLDIDGHLLSTNSVSYGGAYDYYYGRYAIDHSDDLWLDIESWHHGRKYRINSTPGINYPTPKAEFDSWEGVENYVRTYFLNKSKK